jgi:hypothetical protein
MTRILLDGVPAWIQGQAREIVTRLLARDWYLGDPSLDFDDHELLLECDGWKLYSAYGEPIISWVYRDEWFSFDWSCYWRESDEYDDYGYGPTSKLAIDRALQDFGHGVEQLSLI